MALYHTAKGSVDYTMVGSPTIVDGVASGFSASDYLITSPQTKDITTCEWNMKFNTRTIPSVNGFVLGYKVNSGVIVTASKKIRVAWEDSTSTTVEKELNYILSDDTDYVLNCVFNNTNSTAIVTLKNSGGTTLITETYSDVSYKKLGTYFWIGMRGGSSYTNNYWRGSIDLNNTYIKVNEQPWLGLCPVEVQKHQLMGPVGYTKVGSPTIVDGVASGFSASDYLKINNNFSSSSNFEIVVRGTAIDAAAQRACLAFNNGSNGFLDIGSGPSGIRLALKYNGSLTSFRIYPNLIEGSLYYIHIIKTNSTLTLGYSTDGKNILLSEDFSLTSFDDWAFSYILLGVAPWQSATSYGGSIDLNETYIKVNGKLWFWQPQKSKYIVKDGKLVWADTHIYIDDNGTKTYATQNIAPVPAGYTFGTTTTPSIGYVDMRTQQFTAAPQGATIGRDE